MASEDFKKTAGGLWSKSNEVIGKPSSIDLVANHLIGSKKEVDGAIIRNMIKTLENNGTLPPVKVVNFRPGVYFLTCLLDEETGKPCGGNHRAYAHFKLGKELNVEIFPREYAFPSPVRNVRDLTLKRNLSGSYPNYF